MNSDGQPIMLAGLRQRIESTTELPPMPEVAQALLRLNTNPHGNINDVVEIINTDPSIAAQIMRYAHSAFFGYRGEIQSLHQAVTAVMGYSLTLDIALGLSLGKAFVIPKHGAMGIYPFWQHSIYSGALVERIIHIMPKKERPLPGLGFLAGLLHNFGVLLVAHLFKKESFLLQNIIRANMDQPVIELERQVLGTDHMEIGAWLMQSWGLQAEVQTAVAQHHNEHYSGKQAAYSHLCLIADRLLKRHEVGDAESTELPPEILMQLGVNEEQLEQQLSGIIQAGPDLNRLAEQFAA
jgi:HD-like signal output (HDOD) protein